MKSPKVQTLQDPFLNALRKDRIPVSIFLVNGIKLQGHIESFDQYVVLLRNNVSQMVYKHAISTVVPSRNPRGGDTRPRHHQPHHFNRPRDFGAGFEAPPPFHDDFDHDFGHFNDTPADEPSVFNTTNHNNDNSHNHGNSRDNDPPPLFDAFNK